ncbi:serine protease SP24D-like [Anopheles darlingi]|uniref:serine protease SP24D-like n=1 Tax=Anopheles darlingi TaxID=43151 RepID=UPI0021003AAB|nr:serine protease SP24D-like [Anopheles darlingi]XP_049541882.1 serine protease SP24D-like [Anopheles darlingi]
MAKLMQVGSVIVWCWLAVAVSGQRFHHNEQNRLVAGGGTIYKSSRIVGGSVASQGQLPYQVALLRSGSLGCGGSLIDARWVLSAAHCVYTNGVLIPAASLTVLAGTINLNTGGLRRAVARVLPHERYGNFRNDVALLLLQQPLATSSTIRPIALRTAEVPAGSEIIISGWGRIFSGGPVSTWLRFNRATVLASQRCAAVTGIPSGLICFTSPINNGACNGDSGGPAVMNNELVGVANFIINYCGSGNPDGYAKVSDYVPWIQATMRRY